jgi:hypothetical protein
MYNASFHPSPRSSFCKMNPTEGWRQRPRRLTRRRGRLVLLGQMVMSSSVVRQPSTTRGSPAHGGSGFGVRSRASATVRRGPAAAGAGRLSRTSSASRRFTTARRRHRRCKGGDNGGERRALGHGQPERRARAHQ